MQLPALIDAAIRALTDARSIDDVLAVRDRAAGIQRLTRGVESARDAHNRAGEIKLYAERRIGEELARTEKAKGQLLRGSSMEPREQTPTLDDLGITKKQSHIWQALASVPADDFARHLEEARQDGEVTTAGALRLARRLANDKRRDAIAEREASAPTGRYGCIVMDPPWPMSKIEREVRPNQTGLDYPTMSEADLHDFGSSVATFAEDDCHLFMWATQRFLPLALELTAGYGFRYVLTMVWHKPGGFQPLGLPQYNCEFVVYGRKGTPTFRDTKAFDCCFTAPRREHSRKPDAFYDTIRRVTHERRIDLFSREPREGFDQFGNEVEKFAREAG